MDKNKEIIPTANNSKYLEILAILKPSALGVTVYSLFIIATVTLNQASQYTSSITSLKLSDLKGTSIYQYIVDIKKVIDSQIVNQIGVYVFWVIIGFIIFIIASRLTKNMSELTDDIGLRHYIWPRGKDKNAPVKEFIERLFFHIVIAIAFIVYMYKATPVVANIWHKNTTIQGLSLNSLLHMLLLILIEFIYLHVAVIIIRLFLLKKRIINS